MLLSLNDAKIKEKNVTSISEVLYIVIPAFNEQTTIEKVVKEWHDIVVNINADSRIVVIDDGSTDQTYSILKKLMMAYKQLIVLHIVNCGHGAAILHGYHYAVENGADFIFQTDADGQTLPAEFWGFWEQRSDYDMVIGHRNHRQDGVSRIIVTKVLRLVIFLCFRIWVTDANTPFRLMCTCTLKELLPFVPKDFYLSNVLLSILYEKYQKQVKYWPITFRQRQGGKNSIDIRKIIRIGCRAVKDFMIINNDLSLKE